MAITQHYAPAAALGAETKPVTARRAVWHSFLDPELPFLKCAHARLEKTRTELVNQQKHVLLLERCLSHDTLTGLLNERGFHEVLGRDMARVQRGYSKGGLLILIDLDNFKMINDLYGRDAGDAALRVLARTLQQGSRDTDACARLRNDEFALMMTDTTKSKAVERAQALIRQLNGLSVVWYGAEMPLRASLEMKEYNSRASVEGFFKGRGRETETGTEFAITLSTRSPQKYGYTDQGTQ